MERKTKRLGVAEDDRGVAHADTTAIVGAFVDDDNGASSGSAYLFDVSDPYEPIQIAKLLSDDGAAEDRIGYSVEISGTTAIIGAVGDQDNGTWSGSAYLFDAASAPACPADLDGSGDVGPFDLAFVLGFWGLCPDPDDCPADIDGDAEVGPLDLALLLGSWGPCP